MPRLLAVLTTALLACACALPGPALAAKKTYFRVGNAADAAAEATAGTVLMDGSTVVGASNAYFIEAPGAPQVCSPGLPLTYRNVGVRRVGAGESFNVAGWRGSAY